VSRTYKYRLSPTKKQQYLLAALFDQMQTVYNDALNERRWAWRQSRRSITYYDQWNRMREERHKCRYEMAMLNATSIQQMLRRVDKAHRAFYTGQRGAPALSAGGGKVIKVLNDTRAAIETGQRACRFRNPKCTPKSATI
jgi:putative transposase